MVASRLILHHLPLTLPILQLKVGALTCGAGVRTRSRRKAWVGGIMLASPSFAVTVTITMESEAAVSGTSSHRRPQADSFCSR